MPQRRVFEPDVTLGQLLVLAKLGAISQAPGVVPSWKDLEAEFDASDDSIRRALQVIAAALNPDGTDTESGPRRSPSTKWRNIGGAAVLAHLIINIAQDPETNQDRLMLTLREFIDHSQARYDMGVFSRAPHDVSF